MGRKKQEDPKETESDCKKTKEGRIKKKEKHVSKKTSKENPKNKEKNDIKKSKVKNNKTTKTVTKKPKDTSNNVSKISTEKLEGNNSEDENINGPRNNPAAFEDNSEVTIKKPTYKNDDILVTYIRYGRSSSYHFYKIQGFTKTASPRVFEFDKNKTEIHNNPGSSKHKVEPLLDRCFAPPPTSGGRLRSSPDQEVICQKTMRWYKSHEQYLDPSLVQGGGFLYATTEIYDPNETYYDEWMSD
jgi:hypothetical protein